MSLGCRGTPRRTSAGAWSPFSTASPRQARSWIQRPRFRTGQSSNLRRGSSSSANRSGSSLRSVDDWACFPRSSSQRRPILGLLGSSPASTERIICGPPGPTTPAGSTAGKIPSCPLRAAPRTVATVKVAAYARYSSDAQREASLEDQLRNCRQYAARMGWPEPVVYTDAAVSGARNDRPGYLRLLADAPRFDVILVDDLTRLSRDSVEATKATRRLTFAGVRVIGVSDGLDTGRKGHKAEVGLRGLMGELYLDDLREKTHRGLMGRALDGASAGGLPYGYRVSATGQREIREDQAEIVRRIYAEYLAGRSPREIVAGLNRDRVPSPRGRTWAASAVAGDVRRGIGILANPIYAGRQVWNRSRWVKHPDTGRRVRQERPQSEWVVTEH